MSHAQQNMSSGVSDQGLEMSAKEFRDTILSKQQTTKSPIRLRGCAG